VLLSLVLLLLVLWWLLSAAAPFPQRLHGPAKQSTAPHCFLHLAFAHMRQRTARRAASSVSLTAGTARMCVI
jgi:hypothetical protein